VKRFKYLLIIVSVLLSLDSGVASAYEPAIQWEKTFGGSDSAWGRSVQQTSDGGYIIAGETSFGAGLSNVYLIKTDSGGKQEWQKTIGGSYSEYGLSVKQTGDGGYIIAGWTTSFGAGDADVYLIKTDSAGNLLWQRTFGGNSEDIGYSVQQTFDGGYIIAGKTYSFGAGFTDVYLIKTDSAGNLMWQKTFGGSDEDIGISVLQTTDGGYIIVGYTESFAEGYYGDVYLIKTDPNGDLLWQKTFGGNGLDGGDSIQRTIDGGYIIVGTTASVGAWDYDVYLIKTDLEGNLQWQKTFGGGENEFGESVQQTSDGGYIIAGSTVDVNKERSDVYLVKTDSAGNLQWQKTFGGSDDDYGYSVQQTTDGGYIVAGTTYSFGTGGDVYLIKLSAEVCQYVLAGDVNNDCKFDFYDFALMAANWLIDCNIDPENPACVPK
jgi:hypothetical protein